MTDFRIVHMTADGRCAVSEPSETFRRPGESDPSLFARVIESLRRPGHPDGIPDGVEPVILHKDDVPGDVYYRAARKLEGGKIVWNMEKARAMHADRIRAARAPMLAALDVQMLRAIGSGDKPDASIETEKQRLRDAPADPAIAAAKTIEELHAAWPL